MPGLSRLYRSGLAQEYRAEGYAEGRAEGYARAIMIVLEECGIEVPSTIREKIFACRDTATLKTWVRRTGTIDSIKELFD